MPAPSISLSHIGWSTPDGRVVLDNINLDFGRERAGLVGRNGVGKSSLLRIIGGVLEPSKGAVRVQGAVAMLRQTVQVSMEETVADSLGAAQSLAVLQRAEAGLATLDELADADWTVAARAAEALADMGLDVALDAPLHRLSGGQRTRAALAGLIFARPDFLLLDEPTNDLDRAGRQAVRDILAKWNGGAIVVSHDRELLETLDAIVELTSVGANRYGGGWSHYQERKAIELAAAEQDLATAERHRDELARKAQDAHERQQRRDAGGRRNAARGGMPRILLGARREQAEHSGANLKRLAERQRDEGRQAVEQARSQVEIMQPLSMTIAPVELPSSKTILSIDRVTVGYAQERAVLRDLSLHIVGPERIAVTGANGSGKSTLLALIAGALAPWSGSVARPVAFALLDQRVTMLRRDDTIAGNFRRLNPGMDENGCRAALARFRFRAEAADQPVDGLSGGQMLRAALACVLGSAAPPPLLILDEPTNHLDLDAIAAVEAALNAYDGALLVVSHDETFLERIVTTRRFAMPDP